MPQSASWSGSPSVMGSTESMRMALLTFSLVGLQFTWGIEMTYCTPYLLQLGLTKSKTSLVWLAGPLSGLIMQPVVGAIADRSTSRWGRRRPFMVGGSVIVSICLLLLGWTSEFVGLFVEEESSKKSLTIVTAVLSIYAVDFAINAVMASCRGLIVDTLPISQQQQGSAWASRMAACGHVVGYLIGTLDLVKMFGPMFGDTQFKKMILVAASALLIAVGITSYAVTERVLLATPGSSKSDSVFSILPSLLHRTLHLPPRIKAICWAQFWSWIGWFPFLFYSTTWVGETYYRYEHPTNTAASTDSSGNHDALGNIGRLGSFSLVIFSLITFASSVFLPYLVKSPDSNSTSSRGKFTPRPPPSLSKNIQRLFMRMSALQPDLVTAWLISHLAFTAIMVWAPFVRSLAFATTLVALAGVPWAVVGWAPFAELGVEINKLAPGASESTLGTSGGYNPLRPPVGRGGNDDLDDDVDIEMEEGALRRDQHLSNHGGPNGSTMRFRHDSTDASSTGDLAGVYLGVLNVYTTLPQFVGTFISWVVFSLLEPSAGDDAGRDDDHPEHHKWLDLKKDAPNAIAVCLFIGACCAVVAAEATRRLKRMG